MKVWYILMTFPSPSEAFVANDIRALIRLGVRVSVHALRGPRSDAERLLRERGLEHLQVTHGTVPNILRGVLSSLLHPIVSARLTWWVIRNSGGHPAHVLKGLALLPRIFGLFEHLRRDPPDVVHIYWGHYPAIFGQLVLDRAPNVLLSLSLSAYDLLRGYPGSMAVARNAHVVSTWAAANIPAIAQLGVPSESVHVSWQGVDLEKIKTRRLDKIRRRVVTAGRLIPEKRMDDVIRAFARIAANCSDASLVVLGDGPDRRRLEELAASLGLANAIAFRGHVAHEEVFEELGRAELFLFLSSHSAERLPNVVKEAMACRCVVITSATCGIDELMRDGVHGWVVPQGAPEQAAGRAIEVFAHMDGAHAIATAAQTRVFENFDVLRLMEGMVRRWEHHGAPPRATEARLGARPSPETRLA